MHPSTRAKHILQCKRVSLNCAPYQQRYRSGRRAHRKTFRTFLQFCYSCTKFYENEADWITHCEQHLNRPIPRCGLLRFRSTLVLPGFCPFCLGERSKRADERFYQWMCKATLLNHVDQHLASVRVSIPVPCPHPCCLGRLYDSRSALRHHFFDGHSIEEPRSNCTSRKRASSPDDLEANMEIKKKKPLYDLKAGMVEMLYVLV